MYLSCIASILCFYENVKMYFYILDTIQIMGSRKTTFKSKYWNCRRDISLFLRQYWTQCPSGTCDLFSPDTARPKINQNKLFFKLWMVQTTKPMTLNTIVVKLGISVRVFFSETKHGQTLCNTGEQLSEAGLNSSGGKMRICCLNPSSL